MQKNAHKHIRFFQIYIAQIVKHWYKSLETTNIMGFSFCNFTRVTVINKGFFLF